MSEGALDKLSATEPAREGVALSPAAPRLLSAWRRRVVASLSLESTAETAFFWAITLGFGVLIVAWPYLPFTDYPAHLGLAGSLNRVLRGQMPDVAIFETNLASYNSLFHLSVALLAMLMPVDLAAGVVTSLIIALTCAGLLSLLRACGRPPHRAFLGATFAINYPMAWGFSNFCLGTAIGLFVVARVIRRQSGASWRFDAFTLLLAMVGMCTHLMATCAIYALCLMVLLTKAFDGRGHAVQRFWNDAIRGGLPLLPPIAYAAWVYFRQESGHVQNSDFANLNGLDNHAWHKFYHFFGTATGFRSDGFDQYLLQVVFLALLVAWLLRKQARRRSLVPVALLVTSVALYTLLPEVVWSTARVFQRMTLLICIFAVVATPPATAIVDATERFVYPALGLCALLAFGQMRLAQAPGLRDLQAVVDEAPPGRHVAALVDEAYLEGWGQNAVGHVGGYYVARRGGEVAVSFARYMSLPVHYREGATPPLAPGDLAWHGTGKYDRHAAYAKYFDLVLLRTIFSHEERVREVFSSDAPKVRILSSHGEWAIIDARGIYEAEAE